KYFFIISLFLLQIQAFCVLQETASLRDFLYGTTEDCEYDNWISHISEGIASDNYNLYAPYDRQLNGFGEFNIASAAELDIWETAVEYFLQGDLESAEWYLELNGFPFEIVEFHDTDTDRTYYMIRETLNMSYYDDNGTPETEDDEIGGFDFGWGIHLFNPEALNPIIITVVHPCDDYMTPPVAIKCFQEWDAMFLQIAGAGREVEWTEVGSYNNSKSLSDPSRNTNHAYTKAYNHFCDKIREEFDRREFSSQIHSYDWDRHMGYANCQISAGYAETCPNLPIRDMSDLKLDVINASNHLIHEPNTIGDNSIVYLNDFYSVHYNEFEFIYSDADTSYAVNNEVDLVGYSQNRQMLYSFLNWNSYDVFEPFFHLEMDELPNCYPQIESNLNWFYGYDTETGQFNMDQIFDMTLQYYEPFINAMTEVLPDMFIMDDDLVPLTPASLSINYMGYNEIELSWEPVSSYDFKTYEIYYNTDHITEFNYVNLDRFDQQILACPDLSSFTISDLEENQQYYFMIRAIDYNENYSGFSSEVYAITAPAEFADFSATGEDAKTSLKWEMAEQSNVLGYRIYRRTLDTPYIILDDYHNNLELLGGNEQGNLYQYHDFTAENGEFYSYQIASVNQAAFEYIYEAEAECSPREIYFLEFYDPENTLLDSVAFSANPYASDNYDELYDIIKPDPQENDILYSAFYESSWGAEGIYLSREIMGIYDPESSYQTWTLKVRSELVGESLKLKVSDNYERNVEKLYVYNFSTGEMKNIADDEVEFTVSDSNFITFTLYWGNILPNVYFTYQANRIYQENDELLINWNIDFPELVDHVDLFVSNYEDSLGIASNLPSSQTSYQWIVPADLTMQNARFSLDIYTEHDEFFLRSSPFFIGFFTLEQAILPVQGWQMISNPWLENPLQMSEDFVYRTELYKLDDENGYCPTDTMYFGEGYWLKTLSPSEYLDDSLIEKETHSHNLSSGWNLVANPHLCSYDVEDLKFQFQGNNLTFNQSVRDQFISRAIYVYRTIDTEEGYSGEYQLVSKIEPKESFWLYCQAEQLLDPKCIFIPYNNSYYLFPDPDIQVKIELYQNAEDFDELVLGFSNTASQQYDYKYDLPEPPVKPFLEAISAYFIKDTVADSTFPYEKLNWEYRHTLSNSVPDEEIWDFEFAIDEPGPVYFRTEFLEVLPTYEIIMDIEELQTELNENEIVTFTAENSGSYQGSISINNGLTLANTITEKSVLSNFPNPFNPETTFRFNLPQDSFVELEIYNIKGQKINTIFSGLLLKGNYEFLWEGVNSNHQKVSSGIYFVRYKTGNTEQISKLLLLK
ncbi:MAG: hypothetical protein APR54_00875, partial [Candidatus Cloacimonas sp. SDB]